jgi:hypothetical protein
MENKNLTITIPAGNDPMKAFDAITNVRGWWTENLEGNTEKLGDEFIVRFGDVHYSKQKLVEVIPGKKVVWLVTDSRLNFVKQQDEWTDTKVSFDIGDHNGKTEITFTHIGLTPSVECYGGCSGAWQQYVEGSLAKLAIEGVGEPTLME